MLLLSLDLVFVISSDEQLRNWTKSMMRDAINRHPDCVALAVLAANASLISGSYQHALRKSRCFPIVFRNFI